MSTEDNRTLAHRWAEIWNHEKDLSVIDEIVDANFVSHSSPPGLAPDREGLKQWATLFRKALPDITSAVDDVIVEGDKVVERFTGSGTQQGEFFGIPPTGKHFITTGINIFRIQNGKIVELWANSDDLGVLQQLGVVPAAG